MDPDVFAILIPDDPAGYAKRCVSSKYNKEQFVPQETPDSSFCLPPSPSDTSSTDLDDDIDDRFRESQQETMLYQHIDHLVLRFSHSMVNPMEGFQFGTAEKSDICLPRDGARRPSSRQFNIAIESNYSIWLHDYHSKFGTAVGYDGKCSKQFRKKNT